MQVAASIGLYAEKFRDVGGILFDLDYTLVTFGEMKRSAVNRAINAMVDAGIPLAPSDVKLRIYMIYKQRGIEYQRVFDDLLTDLELSRTVRNRIWAAGVHGYREARRGSLDTYPHTVPTLLELSRRGLQLGVVSNATEKEVWLRIYDTHLEPFFKVVVTLDEENVTKPTLTLSERL